jgi:hypothetical protein
LQFAYLFKIVFFGYFFTIFRFYLLDFFLYAAVVDPVDCLLLRDASSCRRWLPGASDDGRAVNGVGAFQRFQEPLVPLDRRRRRATTTGASRRLFR